MKKYKYTFAFLAMFIAMIGINIWIPRDSAANKMEIIQRSEYHHILGVNSSGNSVFFLIDNNGKLESIYAGDVDIPQGIARLDDYLNYEVISDGYKAISIRQIVKSGVI